MTLIYLWTGLVIGYLAARPWNNFRFEKISWTCLSCARTYTTPRGLIWHTQAAHPEIYERENARRKSS